VPAVDSSNADAKAPYASLSPSLVLDALESRGYATDGHILPLNSYENRVYQVGLDDAAPLITKFYRPGRWNDAQILEEHAFSFELVEHELPVVAPLCDDSGRSLFEFQGYRFALFPRKGGRAPELSNPDNLLVIGRLLGRLHGVGAKTRFQHRPRLDGQSFGHHSIAFVSAHFIPTELKTSYDSLTADLMCDIDAAMAQCDDTDLIRVHGDCHIGNLLWREGILHFVDLDDTRMAPAIQDIWMLLSGTRTEQTAQLAEIVEGYNEFFDFHPQQLRILESLRTLRMLHYSAWLARRWQDPAFPHNFPWFNTNHYWGEHILQLREQLSALREPPLQLAG